MNTLKSTWIWLCRFRQRKGYGVHSPFAYRFIRTVLNEREQYYAYRDLQPLRSQLEATVSESVDKLLFRLANFAQPRNVVWVGQGSTLSFRYIQAGCRNAQCQQVVSFPMQSLDMLILGEDTLNTQLLQDILPYMSEQTVVVALGLYNTPAHKAQWQAWTQHKTVIQAFDLYECGVLLFNPHYQKQTFKVNFIAV